MLRYIYDGLAFERPYNIIIIAHCDRESNEPLSVEARFHQFPVTAVLYFLGTKIWTLVISQRVP